MPRKSPKAFVRNWSASELPTGKKALLAARNILKKAVTGQTCCGHPGEPGC